MPRIRYYHFLTLMLWTVAFAGTLELEANAEVDWEAHWKIVELDRRFPAANGATSNYNFARELIHSGYGWPRSKFLEKFDASNCENRLLVSGMAVAAYFNLTNEEIYDVNVLSLSNQENSIYSFFANAFFHGPNQFPRLLEALVENGGISKKLNEAIHNLIIVTFRIARGDVFNYVDLQNPNVQFVLTWFRK